MTTTSTLERVGAALQQLAQGTLSDNEIRQHVKDCAWLMEQAYERFERHGELAGREEAVMWLDRRDTALRALQARGMVLGDDCGWFASDAAQAVSRRSAV